MSLTAEQRYHQAVMKARLTSRRALREMMEGKRDTSGECTMDLERKFIIAEIERAIEERDELQAVFDHRWEADMRAIKRWQAAQCRRVDALRYAQAS